MPKRDPRTGKLVKERGRIQGEFETREKTHWLVDALLMNAIENRDNQAIGFVFDRLEGKATFGGDKGEGDEKKTITVVISQNDAKVL